MLRGILSKIQSYAKQIEQRKQLYHDRRSLRRCVDCGATGASKARCDDCAAKAGTKFRWVDDGTAETIITRNGRAELGEKVEK